MNELIEEKSWWSRNWKWAAPTGGCLFVIIAFAIFAGSMVMGLSSLFENSTAHSEALERVSNNKEVLSFLGEPIETDGIPQGNINIKNGEKKTELSVPIKGPKGEALINVKGYEINDIWTYEVMSVTINENNKIINLLTDEEINN